MKNFDFINNFFEIEPAEVLKTLSNVINIQSAYIYYLNPTKLEFSYGEFDGKEKLEEELKVKNTTFGKIIITGENFTQNDKKIFKTCSIIAANIIKQNEVNKIMKMQTNALQESYTEIKKAEAIKTKFISHISHELRTPLNSILGFSDLIGLAGEINDKQKEYLNDIKISGLHLLEMINEILDMSKIEAGAIKLNIREFEIDQVIEEVTNIIRPLLIQKNINLTMNIKNYKIQADFQKIQQILFNLLSNAIKFTPTNGQITIETELIKTKALISIKDTGCGIAKKDFDKIFQKFEQLNNATSNSTGLGLSIAQELAKLHNGEITVESEIKKGTKFTVAIPSKP